MTKLVHVAVGVIQNPRGEIFIAKRAADAHQGGLWEFPGGKLESGETTPQALARELREELDIEVDACQPLIQIRHHYPDKSVLLDVYRVTRFRGEPIGNEGQPVRWVAPQQLHDFEFPAANRPIIKAITLAERMAISGVFTDAQSLIQPLQYLAAQGISQLILRSENAALRSSPKLISTAVQSAAALQLQLQVNCSPLEFEHWQAHGAGGLHLNSHQLMQLNTRPVAANLLLGASCHNQAELQQAAQIGVDYALLSPVLPTSSHPDAELLGWDRFARLVETVNFPVYALGGMSDAHLSQAQAMGAQGIAAISAWWQQ